MRSPPPTVHPYHSDPPLPPQRGADVLHSSNSGHRVGPVRSNPWATFSGDIRSSCATAAGSRSGTWLWPTSWSSCRSSSWPLSVSGVAGGVLDGGDGGRRRERLMTAVRGGPQGRQSTGAAGEDDMEGGEAMRWTMQRTKRSVIESDSLWWLSAIKSTFYILHRSSWYSKKISGRSPTCGGRSPTRGGRNRLIWKL
jgi:hypothetical protein